MTPVPSSLVAAVLVSAAAGKNPWVPFGLLALVAAPASVPVWLLDPAVHARLHGIAPAPVLWTVGAVMVVLALLESFGDKLPGVEAWLLPVSTAWRPLAATSLASLVAWAGLDVPPAELPQYAQLAAQPVAQAQFLGFGELTWAGLTVVLGTFAGYLASVGKVGGRLLLSMVPIPGLKLAHSFADDAFALIASALGLMLADSKVVLSLVVIYLVIGLFTGPWLARLASIYVRVLWSVLRLANPDQAAPELPKWARDQAREIGADPNRHALRVYTFRARHVGRARHGYLLFGENEVRFVSKALFGVNSLRVPEAEIARIGLAETATVRAVTLVGRTPSGSWESRFYLFPARRDAVDESLVSGARHAQLVAVSADSQSARVALPGHGLNDERYRPASVAGDLRMQAITSIISASVVGVLTMGVYIPIGAGYVLSPFPRRFLVSTLLSIYLAFSAVGTAFTALPVTIAYGVILNLVALRDLTRHAVKARVDGFVDKSAFLPLPDHHVWVPRDAVLDPTDTQLRTPQLVDGPWRLVVEALGASVDAPRAI